VLLATALAKWEAIQPVSKEAQIDDAAKGAVTLSILAGSSRLHMKTALLFYCPHDSISLDVEWHSSNLVLVGQVRGATRVAAKGNDMGGIAYRIHPTEILRGHPKTDLRIYSEDDSGRFPMDIGRSYLLFLRRVGSTWRVDNCGHSAPVDSVPSEWLQRLRALHVRDSLARLPGR
jgi:hypothetical protein